MKLLLDENLPPLLAKSLAERNKSRKPCGGPSH
jgi:hypothetical protein